MDSLELVFSDDLRFSLAAGGSTQPIPVGQPGARGATAGRFQLTVFDGQPLFQGSVDVGPMDRVDHRRAIGNPKRDSRPSRAILMILHPSAKNRYPRVSEKVTHHLEVMS